MNRTGIPLEKFPSVERTYPADGAWHLVQACRLIEKKGLDDTLQAFAAFRALHPRARLTIAGEGPLLPSLEELREKLGLKDSVQFAGFLNGADLCSLYHSAHVFLHPSRMTGDQNQEGIPNSMLEAMATGLPVAATLHGGIPEAVRDGISGFLTAERDREALFESLKKLTQDEAIWQRMSLAAADDVRENFESAAQIAKLEAAYMEAIASK
jgi:colanic acid/amylovoran biosynthesis glycosyltransferase